MRWISTRDLRNTPGKVRKWLADEDLVLTSGGTPVAYMVGIEGDDLEGVLSLMRRLRAQRALSHMRREAAEEGRDSMPIEEIQSEVRRTRRERTARR
ncbi:MAG: hypothetical protein ACREMD_00615 [Gemmatimonadota bacterium]